MFQSLVVDGWNLLVGGVFFGGHLVAHHTLKLKSLMLFCCAQSGSGSRDLLCSGESNVFFGPYCTPDKEQIQLFVCWRSKSCK